MQLVYLSGYWKSKQFWSWIFGQGQTSKAKASLLQGQGHKIWP